MAAALLGLAFLLLVVSLYLRRNRARNRQAYLSKHCQLCILDCHRVALPMPDRINVLWRGHDRRACNVMSGQTPYGVATVFELTFEVGWRSTRHVRTSFVVVVETSTESHEIHLLRNGCDYIDDPTLTYCEELLDDNRGRLVATDTSPMPAQLHSALRAWFGRQSLSCSWQITPGAVVGYSTNELTMEQCAKLYDLTIDLCKLLDNHARESQENYEHALT